METTEEILNKLLERIEWCKKQVVDCEEQRSFWAKRGNLFLAEAWKCVADWHRKSLEETEKRIEEVNKKNENDKED